MHGGSPFSLPETRKEGTAHEWSELSRVKQRYYVTGDIEASRRGDRLGAPLGSRLDLPEFLQRFP
jgi:hypothetical protein